MFVQNNTALRANANKFKIILYPKLHLYSFIYNTN